MAEMLAMFEQGPYDGMGATLTQPLPSQGIAPWLVSMIRCINPQQPNLGFSEISTYISYVMQRHPEAVHVQPTQTWARNPDSADEWRTIQKEPSSSQTPAGPSESSATKYCCNTDPLLATRVRAGFEYFGTELGHADTSFLTSLGVTSSKAGGDMCGYTSDKFFLSSPYPPASHSFWTSRGVKFYKQAPRTHSRGTATHGVRTTKR